MYNYSLVFENQHEKGQFLIVQGETLFSPAETIAKASALVAEPFSFEIVNFVYQPKKVEDYETQKKK